MAQARQTVQQDEAEECRERRTKNGELEGKHVERGPAMKRPSPSIDRIVDDGAVPLHEIRGCSAEDPADQRKRRSAIAGEAEAPGSPPARERGGRLAIPIRGSAPACDG